MADAPTREEWLPPCQRQRFRYVGGPDGSSKDGNVSFPIGEPVTPRCPNCGKSGQLRVHIPAVFAIDPSGRPPGYNPIPVANDGPDRKDPAFCAAEGCEWLGQYRDLVMR